MTEEIPESFPEPPMVGAQDPDASEPSNPVDEPKDDDYPDG